MNIKTVKLQGNGYLLNGTMSVPMANGNIEYELIKKWLAEGNTPEPEFTEAELDEQATAKVKAEALAYLSSTDWIKSKYVELVVMKKTMTEEEFNLKYEAELAKMDEARSIL